MLIRCLWQLKTVVFMHCCIICAVLFWERGVTEKTDTLNYLEHLDILPQVLVGVESVGVVLEGDVPGVDVT